MKMLASVCLGACIVALLVPSSIAGKERVALVIGIDRYAQLPADKQLRKAGNDAKAIAEALSDVGFKVSLGENVGRREFNRLWARFLNRLSPGDVAAFFFSGHGVELSGENFLIPADIPKLSGNDEPLLRDEAISMQRLLADLRDKRPRVNLLIIDACRDNPFSDGLGRSVGATRGLARVNPPSGTFMMYSAGAGQKALDRLSNSDQNPNSVYTRSLLPLIKQEGLRIQDVAIRVRRKVHKLAKRIGHTQRPAYYDEVLGTFYLAGKTDKRRDVRVEDTAQDDQDYSTASRDERDIARAWNAIADTESCAAIDAFLRRYSDGIFAELARAKRAEVGCRQKSARREDPATASTPERFTRMRSIARLAGGSLSGGIIRVQRTGRTNVWGHEVLLLSLKLKNTGGRKFGLARHEYPNRSTSLMTSSGGNCQGQQIRGLEGVPTLSNGAPNREIAQRKQTILSPGQ
jgi:hypothetical protein